MFKRLTDFAYNRTGKEAFGFYLAYLFFIVVLAAIVGIVISSLTAANDFNYGIRVGTIIVTIAVLLLSFVIINKKNLWVSASFIVLGFLGAFLAYFGGALLGLVPVAYLTTRVGPKNPVKNPTALSDKPSDKPKDPTIS